MDTALIARRTSFSPFCGNYFGRHRYVRMGRWRLAPVVDERPSCFREVDRPRLIFVFRDDAQSLARIFLMHSSQQRRALWTLVTRPIVALDKQVFNIFHAPDLNSGRVQARRRFVLMRFFLEKSCTVMRLPRNSPPSRNTFWHNASVVSWLLRKRL